MLEPADTLSGASAVQFVNLVSPETIKQLLRLSKEHSRKLPPLEVWARFAGFPETDWVVSWDRQWEVVKAEPGDKGLLSGGRLRTEMAAAGSKEEKVAQAWHSNLREMAARDPQWYANCWEFTESGKLSSVYEADMDASKIRCSTHDMYWKTVLKPSGSLYRQQGRIAGAA